MNSVDLYIPTDLAADIERKIDEEVIQIGVRDSAGWYSDLTSALVFLANTLTAECRIETD
jgi:hypothetical protein